MIQLTYGGGNEVMGEMGVVSVRQQGKKK